MGKNLYMYEGPVKRFETVVIPKWVAYTWAISERQAKSNFLYQFKLESGLVPRTNVSLPGKITIVEEGSN